MAGSEHHIKREIMVIFCFIYENKPTPLKKYRLFVKIWKLVLGVVDPSGMDFARLKTLVPTDLI